MNATSIGNRISICGNKYLPVVLFIPLGKVAEAFAEGDLGGEAKVFFQSSCVCVGCGDVSGLHGDQLLVGLEVVVLGQDTSSQEFFLEDVYKVQQILRLTATDVVDLVGRDGQAVFAGLLGRSFLHHSYNALNNVVHVREVPAAVAVVVNLDGLALEQLVGEPEVRHIRAAGRTIDREETEAGAGDVVELAVAVGHQLVALLGGGIEGDGIVHPVVRAEGNLLVAAIDAGGTGIDQMLDGIVSARLQDVVEPNDVALDVHIRILDAVAHTRLGGQVHHYLGLVLLEQFVDELPVRNTPLDGDVVDARRLRLLQLLEPVLLQAGVIVIVEVVNAHDRPLLHLLEEALHQITSNEPRVTGN